MSLFRRLFGGGPKAPPELEPPSVAERFESTLPASLVAELESLGFYLDETSYSQFAATRREGRPRLSFKASWASKFKIDIGVFVGGVGTVPGRWVVAIHGLLVVSDDSLGCPPLHVALWPRGSILCPPSPCADGAAFEGASHVFDVSPELVSVARLARGHAPLDAHAADSVRQRLAPLIAELSNIGSSQLFMVVEPDGSYVELGVCVYWAWADRSTEAAVRLVERAIAR